MGPEGFATQMTLVWLLPTVNAQMHVEVVLLGECMATRVTDKRPLVPVRRNKEEAQIISTNVMSRFTEPRKMSHYL